MHGYQKGKACLDRGNRSRLYIIQYSVCGRCILLENAHTTLPDLGAWSQWTGKHVRIVTDKESSTSFADHVFSDFPTFNRPCVYVEHQADYLNFDRLGQ